MQNQKTRDQIIETADELFYQQGYENTTFADIAKLVNISRGNFYHHFKTKDEILDAVIDLRYQKTKKMLSDWELNNPSAYERIRCFIQILIENRSAIKKYGCPVGTLTSELAKLNHGAKPGANKVLSLFKKWLAKQFSLMGKEEESDALAMHLLAVSQGVAILGCAYHDNQFIDREVKQMFHWLESLVDNSN